MNNFVIGDNARVSGFAGEEEAAEYLEEELKKLGLDAEIEDYDIDIEYHNSIFFYIKEELHIYIFN